ncbi:MAG: sigma-70 family RNA polymerase sigma factor [Hymenobacter sp.]
MSATTGRCSASWPAWPMATASVAQDLTQNVFVRVLRYRASYQPGQAFRAWVYQMARHVWADHYQRQRPTADLAEVEKTAAHGRAAQAQRAHTDQHQALHEALALLPAAQREVLVLHRFQGFDYAEIGEQLGCTAGAARVKAHRAPGRAAQDLPELRISYQSTSISY